MESKAARRRLTSPRDTEGVCQTSFVDEKRVAAARAAMPTAAHVERATDLFAALSDPTRFRIFFALTQQELCVCDLSRIAERSMAATSHQLQLLRRLGLVTYRMEGKLAYYRASGTWAPRVVADALEHIERGEEG